MSLSWDPDDSSTTEEGWRARLAGWFSPTSAELAGLAVLLVGALVLSGVLWVQAVARPTSFEPAGGGEEHDHRGHATDGVELQGPDEIGVGMAADGSPAGDAPGHDRIEVAGNPSGDGHHDHGDHGSHDGNGSAGPDGPDATASEPVVVHVTGAVRTSGLVSLPAGARIGDAVLAAGGASADALVERVNLARVVVDGEHVHVPRDGDDPATLPPIGGAPAGPGAGGGGGPGGGAAGGGSGSGEPARVHLNRATTQELETLPGIGPARAEAIVTHREQQGPFATPGDLRAVSGIGEATFQRLAPLITVE